jgi:ATP-binding cassette subfamily F protein uup
MDKVVDHLFVFHGNAAIQDFPGNYTQYRLWKTQQVKELNNKTGAASTGDADPSSASKQKNSEKKKLSYKEQRELELLEIEIPTLENEKKTLEEALYSGDLPLDDLTLKSARIGDLIREIEEKTMRWLELSEI